ncbi:MAG: hypothetical protein A2542_00800 [Parcubacteria group bacterium RIFOXYD2_FULL_52_8]|nr:MAG: hypothetical protein A2542_00800 [Parcubacteria group bacterium RIFOXYD2_FULL_52_8]
MQFQVPQFIEVEDTIIGPFTFKQLIFLLGGGGGIYLLKRMLPTFLAYPLMIALALFTWALVFYKINDRPFIIALQSGIKYYFSNKLYLWNKRPKPVLATPTKAGAVIPETMAPTLSRNKLKELSWSLDIHDTLK